MPPPKPGQKAGEFFKNVTTSTLKELSVDDFIAAWGSCRAALAFDCSDCHPNAGTDDVNWAIDTPQKIMARKMVEMVAVINRTNFNGPQKVTCWTCHHGRYTPATSVVLDNWYGDPNSEVDDFVLPDRNQPSADQCSTSICRRSAARAPEESHQLGRDRKQRGVQGIGRHRPVYDLRESAESTYDADHLSRISDRPNSVWAFNGRNGWITTPRAILQRSSSLAELDGQRFEAQLAFPGADQAALNNWRVGLMRALAIRSYVVVQGSGPGAFWRPCTSTRSRACSRGWCGTARRRSATPDTGRLRRLPRCGRHQVPVRAQVLVARRPYTAKLTDIKVNVPIDESIFGAALRTDARRVGASRN